MSETTETLQGPQESSHDVTIESVISLIAALLILLGVVTASRAEEVVFGFAKQTVFAVLYNAFWVVFPFHIRAFFRTNLYLSNAHKVLFHLMRLQALVLFIPIFSVELSLQIGMFLSLITLLVSSGVILWGVGKQASRTSAWLAVVGTLLYFVFQI